MSAISDILKSVPLVDGHNDLPYQFRKLSKEGFDAMDWAADTTRFTPPLATDLRRLKLGGVGAQFWAAYVPFTLSGPPAVAVLMEQMDCIRQFVARYSDETELALSADDVLKIHAKGKLASLIGMEGGHGIGASLAALRICHALGARYRTLTHVKNNEWADASTDNPAHHGLTAFGEQVVKEMNRLGMMVDLSHTSDETVAAALRASASPVICSHSGARAICNHPRNVPDELLKGIAASGGIVMAVFLPEYVTEAAHLAGEAMGAEESRLAKLYPGDTARQSAALAEWHAKQPQFPRPTLRDVADHIDHLRNAMGINHVGIGSDFDGFKNPPPLGLEDVSCFPALLEELQKRGYSDADLKKVAGENILRVMRDVGC